MKTKHTNITDLLALVVFAVFAVCVLMVLLSGAKVYRRLADRGEAAFESRTAVQYVTTRVRQAQTVTVTDFGGCTVLEIPETVDGERYLTRVYCCDGYLRELFCAKDATLAPQDGEKILPATELQAQIEGSLLLVWIDGQQLFFDLTGKGDAP